MLSLLAGIYVSFHIIISKNLSEIIFWNKCGCDGADLWKESKIICGKRLFDIRYCKMDLPSSCPISNFFSYYFSYINEKKRKTTESYKINCSWWLFVFTPIIGSDKWNSLIGLLLISDICRHKILIYFPHFPIIMQ